MPASLDTQAAELRVLGRDVRESGIARHSANAVVGGLGGLGGERA